MQGEMSDNANLQSCSADGSCDKSANPKTLHNSTTHQKDFQLSEKDGAKSSFIAPCSSKILKLLQADPAAPTQTSQNGLSKPEIYQTTDLSEKEAHIFELLRQYKD